jgi:hypothetical protein
MQAAVNSRKATHKQGSCYLKYCSLKTVQVLGISVTNSNIRHSTQSVLEQLCQKKVKIKKYSE